MAKINEEKMMSDTLKTLKVTITEWEFNCSSTRQTFNDALFELRRKENATDKS